jgi:hypothetical protein
MVQNGKIMSYQIVQILTFQWDLNHVFPYLSEDRLPGLKRLIVQMYLWVFGETVIMGLHLFGCPIDIAEERPNLNKISPSPIEQAPLLKVT